MNTAPAPVAPRLLRLSTPLERLTIGHHSGPGLRVIFWTQGCSLLCTKRCLNPHLLNPDAGFAAPAPALTAAVLRLARDYRQVEGVTVLGGEPFDQAALLAEALGPVRAAGLSVMVYTGHVYESLLASPDQGTRDLLAICDILVDGPFVDSLYDERLIWRGSSNQRVLLLGARYAEPDIESAVALQGRAVALSLGPRGDLAVSGAQDVVRSRGLRRHADQRGGRE